MSLLNELKEAECICCLFIYLPVCFVLVFVCLFVCFLICPLCISNTISRIRGIQLNLATKNLKIKNLLA